MKQAFSLLVGLLLLSGVMTKAQNLEFNYANGSSATYSVNDIRKITFTADTMNLYLKQGEVFSWHVEDVASVEPTDPILSSAPALDELNSLRLSIYPNPSSTSSRLSYDLEMGDEVMIQLIRTGEGSVVFTKTEIQAAGSQEVPLDLRDLAPGMYSCILQTSRFQLITPFVIQ